jgi:hypothetical protein
MAGALPVDETESWARTDEDVFGVKIAMFEASGVHSGQFATEGTADEQALAGILLKVETQISHAGLFTQQQKSLTSVRAVSQHLRTRDAGPRCARQNVGFSRRLGDEPRAGPNIGETVAPWNSVLFLQQSANVHSQHMPVRVPGQNDTLQAQKIRRRDQAFPVQCLTASWIDPQPAHHEAFRSIP